MKRVRPRQAGHAPTVTVVIPCYNYGHYLRDVVRSVLEQERVVVDIIIVDDASSDGSADVAQAIAQGDSRVGLVRHGVNRGHIATYNDGLALARGDYVVLLSADDLLAPGALARATDLMERYPKVGMVYGIPEAFSTPNPAPVPRRNSSWTTWPGQEWMDWACRRGRNFILSPEVVIRNTAMQEVGLYNPALPHSGDLEYWLRMAAHWDIGRVNGPIHAHYRVHEANMHLTTFATMLVDLQHRYTAFQSVTNLPAGRRRDGQARLRQVRRALAREALVLATRSLDRGESANDVTGLVEFARQMWPPVGRSARLGAVYLRLERPAGEIATWQRALTFYRRQYDRVVWRAWRVVGIS